MAQHRQLATPAYLVAFALICIPPFDAMMQVMPARIHDPRWRFGAFGLMSNAFILPMAGVLLAYMVASLFDHRRFQKVLAVISLAVSLATLALLALFALDMLQIHQDVKPAAQLAFKVASSTALLKAMLTILTLGAFAYAGFRAPKIPKVAKNQRVNTLIIGGKPAVQTTPS